MTFPPVFLSTALFASLILPTTSAQETQAADGQSSQSNKQFWKQVFAGERVLRVHFVVSKANFDAMWPEQTGRGRRGPRADTAFKYVEAKLEVANQTLERIGLRFKGNSSFRTSSGLRRPFKIDTNKYVPKQKLFGRTKVNFSNAFKDPSYLREKIGYEVFAAAGLPTPGVGWAEVFVTVTGEHERKRIGLYNIVEQVDDKFLSRALGKASKKSLLMKPDGISDWPHLGSDPAAYIKRYEVKEGKEESVLIERFAAFTKLVHEGSDEDFAAQIDGLLDTDNMISYLAANCLLGNLDSWVMTPHNYYLIVDAADKKVKILPWDLNECFGSFTMGVNAGDLQNWSVQRPWVADRKILERLFGIESFRMRYEQKLRTLMQSGFKLDHLVSRIAEHRATLSEYLKPDEKAAQTAGIDGSVDQEPVQRDTRERSGRDDRRGGPGRGEPGRGEPGRGGPGRGGPRRGGQMRAGPALLPFLKARIESVQEQLSGEAKGSTLPAPRGRFGPPGRRRR